MDEYRIVVDSREKKCLWHKNVIVKKLLVGDYSIEGYEDKISIERKTIIDLYQTLTFGHKRFKKEISRGLKYDYFAILIIGSFKDVLNKNFKGSEHTRIKGETIIKILFTIHLKYGIPVYFVSDWFEARVLVTYLFNSFLGFYNHKK